MVEIISPTGGKLVCDRVVVSDVEKLRALAQNV